MAASFLRLHSVLDLTLLLLCAYIFPSKRGRFKMKKILALLCVAIPLLSFAREWTSVSGAKVDAEFVEMRHNQVVLKRADGKLLRIDKNLLCKEDQSLLSEKNNSASKASAINSALARMRDSNAGQNGSGKHLLSDEQIKSLIVQHQEKDKPDEKIVFRASFGLPSMNKNTREKYSGKEEVPYRITVQMLEYKKRGGRMVAKLMKGRAYMYILDPDGNLVDTESESLDKLCPT